MYVCVSVCMSVCLYVCLCLYVCRVSVCMSVCLYVCMSLTVPVTASWPTLTPTRTHTVCMSVSVCVFVQVADREDPIGDASRDTLRRHIVDLMLQAPLRVQRQVGEAVTLIADHDFPQQWDYLLQARVHTK
jgi:hypothetical protein